MDKRGATVLRGAEEEHEGAWSGECWIRGTAVSVDPAGRELAPPMDSIARSKNERYES